MALLPKPLLLVPLMLWPFLLLQPQLLALRFLLALLLCLLPTKLFLLFLSTKLLLPSLLFLLLSAKLLLLATLLLLLALPVKPLLCEYLLDPVPQVYCDSVPHSVKAGPNSALSGLEDAAEKARSTLQMLHVRKSGLPRPLPIPLACGFLQGTARAACFAIDACARLGGGRRSCTGPGGRRPCAGLGGRRSSLECPPSVVPELPQFLVVLDEIPGRLAGVLGIGGADDKTGAGSVTRRSRLSSRGSGRRGLLLGNGEEAGAETICLGPTSRETLGERAISASPVGVRDSSLVELHLFLQREEFRPSGFGGGNDGIGGVGGGRVGDSRNCSLLRASFPLYTNSLAATSGGQGGGMLWVFVLFLVVSIITNVPASLHAARAAGGRGETRHLRNRLVPSRSMSSSGGTAGGDGGVRQDRRTRDNRRARDDGRARNNRRVVDGTRAGGGSDCGACGDRGTGNILFSYIYLLVDTDQKMQPASLQARNWKLTLVGRAGAGICCGVHQRGDAVDLPRSGRSAWHCGCYQ